MKCRQHVAIELVKVRHKLAANTQRYITTLRTRIRYFSSSSSIGPICLRIF